MEALITIPAVIMGLLIVGALLAVVEDWRLHHDV